jgi:hypothetical protein
MQLDFMKVVGIIGSVLILGLLLKDYAGFRADVGSISDLIGTLEKAGG